VTNNSAISSSLEPKMVVTAARLTFASATMSQQRHVAEAASALEPFGGGERMAVRVLIARHGSFPASRLHFQTYV